MRTPAWIRASVLFAALCLASANAAERETPFYEIQMVDAETGRGVPLVELSTVHHQRFVTDSAGRIAFNEPGAMNRTVFFSVKSHGYEFPKDAFGYAGARLVPKPGAKEILKLKRKNIAERLYRITGAGIYRDTVLLGYEPPVKQPLLNGEVVGQDSVQPALYRGKIYWFWGDTSRLAYPLGNFRTTGAWSDLPGGGGLDPASGIDLQYFTGEDGFTKKMCPFEPSDGLVWIDGLLTVPGPDGREMLLTHWLRLKTLGEELEHGIATFDDPSQSFVKATTVPLDKARKWRVPEGHPFRFNDGGTEYFYFGFGFPTARVRADYRALLDPDQYEAWTCFDGDGKPARKADGTLDYRWTKNLEPITPAIERKLLESGLVKTNETMFQPVDLESGKTVQIHGGSVRWNPWRKRWITIAVESGGSSYLGEVWYLEAENPAGPWRTARKIVTHDRYTFYNPVHHDFFDQEGGRVIYFEGTYCNTFSGNPDATPFYDYNQMMYRLDLADPRLRATSAD